MNCMVRIRAVEKNAFTCDRLCCSEVQKGCWKECLHLRQKVGRSLGTRLAPPLVWNEQVRMCAGDRASLKVDWQTMCSKTCTRLFSWSKPDLCNHSNHDHPRIAKTIWNVAQTVLSCNFTVVSQELFTLTPICISSMVMLMCTLVEVSTSSISGRSLLLLVTLACKTVRFHYLSN